MLEELKLDYALEIMPYKLGDIGGQTYAQIHPLKKVPTLVDGDVIIHESTAILEYLGYVRGEGRFVVASGDPDYGRFLQWLHFGEAGMNIPINLLLAHTLLLPEAERSERLAAWAGGEVTKLLDFLAYGLGDREHLLERGFSAADISVGYILYWVERLKKLSGAPDNLQTYWRRLSDRPAWVTAIRAGA